MRKGFVGAIACIVITVPALAFVGPAEAAVPAQWQNCTTVDKRLPHGVVRATARDKTSGTPVTNVRRDTALYNTAMRANGGLDRDKDGIACEKARATQGSSSTRATTPRGRDRSGRAPRSQSPPVSLAC